MGATGRLDIVTGPGWGGVTAPWRVCGVDQPRFRVRRGVSRTVFGRLFARGLRRLFGRRCGLAGFLRKGRRFGHLGRADRGRIARSHLRCPGGNLGGRAHSLRYGRDALRDLI